MRDSLLLVSLAAQKYPPNRFTDAVVHNLMGGPAAPPIDGGSSGIL
jgi:hypothetical protein